MKIIHIDVNDKRANAFKRHSKEIAELNGWDEGIIEIYRRPIPRPLQQRRHASCGTIATNYPDVHFEVYIGALRTHFPYNLLHMQTDRFLRDALMEAPDVALSIKQVDLDSLPLPPGFKVTFEHATDHEIEEQDEQHAPERT